METFTDDNGTRFNLMADIYRPQKLIVNDVICRSVGQQLMRGSFQDW